MGRDKELSVLNSDVTAIVDRKNYRYLSKFSWWLGGTRGQRIVGKVDGKLVYLHHIIFGKPRHGYYVDHRDRNIFNNREDNLRELSRRKSSWNRGRNRNNTSGFIGVSLNKNDGKFYAKFCFRGKQMNLGIFSNPITAAKEYDKMAKKYRGRLAVTNFPMRFPRMEQ